MTVFIVAIIILGVGMTALVKSAVFLFLPENAMPVIFKTYKGLKAIEFIARKGVNI